MNSKIIDKILTRINKTSKEKAKFAIIKDYKPIPFSENNFHKITEENYNCKVAYIDGGNTEILKSSELSLQLVQVYGCVQEDNKTVKSEKRSFYVLTQTEDVNGDIYFITNLFPLQGELLVKQEDLCINSMDATLKTGVNRASISSIGGVARKFAEWGLCNELMKEMESGDIVVRDGNLDIDVVNEKNYAELALENAKNKKIILSGLAKTSKVFCDNGNNVGVELDSYGFKGKWHYYPLAENCGTLFAKLHESSKHVFRIDFMCGDLEVDKLVKVLSENSKDMSFPGYPYGLVEADAQARVSDKEKEFLKTLLMSKAGKDLEKIEKLMTTENAHSILDNM